MWNILLAAAYNRRTITYQKIACHFESESAGIIVQLLNCISRYCDTKNLPALTCLAVKETIEFHGTSLSTVEISSEHEAVFNHNWHAMHSVSPTDFEQYA
jgi:hypothetical protein